MTDITQTHLEAALIDQNVAGAYPDTPYAFVAVVAEQGGGWQLGVAVANEPGYNPISKCFKSQFEAQDWAKGLNAHIGLTEYAAAQIIVSTMRGARIGLGR